jgi:hypothetical protein
MITINPVLLKLPAKELKAWIAAMSKDFPETDWAALVQKMKEDVQGTGNSSEEN